MEKDTTIKILEKEIEKLDNKTFRLFFFVYDTKGTPSGSLTYIYQTASYLKELGYDVHMLHAEKEYIGVNDWLTNLENDLPHHNIQDEKLEISASDFLFIPEIFADIMAKTKEMPCKRVAILQNYDFMTELIPVGASWGTLNITDCVTTSPALGDRVKEVFKNVNVNVVRPCVDDIFNTNNNVEKKLIVNIISKDQNDINAIVKPFKWKFPMYGFVPFRYVNGQDKKVFADTLKESAITIWNDPFTDFGISALEAMACGNIVIGKIPESEPEWLVEGDKLCDNGVWYYNTKDIHSLIASVVQTFMRNGLPSNTLDNMVETVSKYRSEYQKEDIKMVYVDTLFKNRREEFVKLLEHVKNIQEK